MNQIVILLGLFTFIAGLSSGVYVFVRNPRNPVFQAFAITTLGMVGWNLTIFLLLTEIGPALLPGRLAFSFVTLIAFGLATFAFLYPTPVRHAKVLIWLNAITSAFFFSIPLWPSYLSFVMIVDGHIAGDLNFQLLVIGRFITSPSL